MWVGDPITVQRLRKLKRKQTPDITFLMETKNPIETVSKESTGSRRTTPFRWSLKAREEVVSFCPGKKILT